MQYIALLIKSSAWLLLKYIGLCSQSEKDMINSIPIRNKNYFYCLLYNYLGVTTTISCLKHKLLIKFADFFRYKQIYG